SQGTVRKAIDEMAAENLLVRKQGKGTFVASHNDPRSLFRFLRLVPEGTDLSYPSSVPLECGRAKAGQEAARILAIKPGASVIVIRRLLEFDAKPVVVDEIHLPGEFFRGLTLDMLKKWHGSLYSLFESRFGLHMIRAEERIRAVAADPRSAELLHVEPGVPLLSVERVTYTYGDRPAEWRRGLYSTADHFYMNELN
ncbi:MAG: GntR family transcriptional regulator, partial [Gammaproteobacteria bacterium]|nr:GntR family transcriptional regulator [Gammaproteobacteria bacterium]